MRDTETVRIKDFRKDMVTADGKAAQEEKGIFGRGAG